MYFHCSTDCVKLANWLNIETRGKQRHVLFSIGNASRFCDSSGTWMKTRVSYCADIELSSALNEV